MIKGVSVYAYWSESKKKVMFRLLQSLSFTLGDKAIFIPEGYETDFASTPRLTWIFIPPVGRYSIPSIVHDFIYDNRIGTRAEADLIFLEMMIKYNVPKLTAYIMYWGVRIGGKKWWDN